MTFDFNLGSERTPDGVCTTSDGEISGGPVSLDTGTGNDHVSLRFAGAAVAHGFGITTGPSDDVVLSAADNEEGEIPILFGFGEIDTEGGSDLVSFIGWVPAFSGSTKVFLGGDDDLLVGDSDSNVLIPGNVESVGGSGSDTVLNAAYFNSSAALQQFETIVE